MNKIIQKIFKTTTNKIYYKIYKQANNKTKTKFFLRKMMLNR